MAGDEIRQIFTVEMTKAKNNRNFLAANFTLDTIGPGMLRLSTPGAGEIGSGASGLQPNKT